MDCANCGAQLPPKEGGTYRCEYCGHSYEIAPEPPPPPPPQPFVQPFQAPIRVVVRAPQRRTSGIAGAFRGMIFLAILGSIAFAVIRRNHPAITAKALTQALDSPVPGLPGERLLWDDVGGPPQIAKLPDGSEAFLGRYRVGTGDQLFFILADGTTMKERWRSGPLGSYSEAYRATHAGIVGAHVVFSDFKSTIHVVDVATGKEAHAIKLTDRVAQICPLGDGSEAWVQVEDGTNVMIDANAGTKKTAPRPSVCADRPSSFRKGFEARASSNPGPKVAGFKANHVFVDGSNAVAEGVKSPGTRIPLLVGFDPTSHAVRWQGALETGDPDAMHPTSHVADGLAGGLFVSTYDLPSKPARIAAFDAKTGTRTWDVELPHQKTGSVDDLVASATRIYVVRSSNVEVLDTKDGKLLGRVGSAWLDDD